MQKKSLFSFSLLIISFLIGSIFISCDKDTDCKVKITVIDGQTNRAVPHASIFLGKDSSDYNISGFTDSRGEFFNVYKHPGIFDMMAKIDYDSKIDSVYYWRIHKEGRNSFRLKEGETIIRELILTESDSIKKLY